MALKTILLTFVFLFCLTSLIEANRHRGESPLVELIKDKYATFIKETYGENPPQLEVSISAFCDKHPEFKEEPLYQITCAVAAQYGGAPNNIAYKN
jgi:hypothetical protein